jgi:hypothetical protein
MRRRRRPLDFVILALFIAFVMLARYLGWIHLSVAE